MGGGAVSLLTEGVAVYLTDPQKSQANPHNPRLSPSLRGRMRARGNPFSFHPREKTLKKTKKLLDKSGFP